MSMTAYALLFTLAAIGISETAYLIRKRVASERPVCPIGGGCEMVLTSKYNKMFAVHNDVLGLLFYFLAGTLSALLVIGVAPNGLWSFVLELSVSASSVLSLVFVYLQWRVIKAWCFWCVMSAVTIWLMAIIIGVSVLL